MKSKVLALLHLLVIIIAYSSPFWLDWRLFFIGLALYYIQILIFKGCVLTWAQYGTFKESFSNRFFTKILGFLGFKTTKESIQYFLNYYLPLLLIITCIIWQLILKMPILIYLI